MRLGVFVMAAAAMSAGPLCAQESGQRVPLWPDGVPGFAERRVMAEVSQEYWTRHVNDPSVHYHPADPAQANGSGVLILPGGAHEFLVTTSEGHDVARWFAERGVVWCRPGETARDGLFRRGRAGALDAVVAARAARG